MHRKFIALIVSAAIAVTGLSLSAAPARADDDTAKIIAGIAALALLGAAIHSSRDRAVVVTRPTYDWHPGRPRYHGPNEYNGNRPQPPIQYKPTAKPRPLPPRFGRYDLPKFCLKPANGFRQDKYLIGKDCLENYYGPTGTLPQACRVTFQSGRDTRTMFRPGCLQQHGYRLVRR